MKGAWAKTYWITKSEMGKVMMWKDEPRKICCKWNGKHLWTAETAGVKVPADYFPELTYEDSPLVIHVESY